MKKYALPAVLMFLAGFCLVYALTGCAGTKIKPWADRTPVEKSLSFMSFYNIQYKDTFMLATDLKSTPAQKAMAMKKKAILKKLYPLIEAYDNLIVLGQIPSLTDETAILNLMNQLGAQL